MRKVANDEETTMQACRLHNIRDLRIEQVPRPELHPGEVLLQVASVGICGSDLHYYLEGRIGTQVIEEPLILGHEFSAWVSELGRGVRNLEPGQLVAVEPAVSCGRCEMCEEGHPNLCPEVRFCGCPPYHGALAEYAVMPAGNCFPLPDDLSPAVGALLEPLGVAIHCVDLAHLRPGSTIAVIGAGPIGLLIAAVARLSGAAEVYVTEPLGTRRQFALSYAADVVLNPSETDVAAEILRLTRGRGVDVAFEASGAPETPQQAADAARIGGKVIVAGIPIDNMMTVTAATARSKGLTFKLVRRMKLTYPRAIRLVHTGAIDVQSLASHHFSLQQTPAAFEMVAGHHGGVLKAIVRVADV